MTKQVILLHLKGNKMTEIYYYTSNRRDATIASIDYDKFVELVNQFFVNERGIDDNNYLQFKRNLKRHSTIITEDGVKSSHSYFKRKQNAFKLIRNYRDLLLDRADRAKSASIDLEYMDEQGFYIPQATGIISFTHSISPECQDDIIINTRLSLTVDIESVGDFVTEFEALVKRYNLAISETTNIEITDNAIENAFAV